MAEPESEGVQNISTFLPRPLLFWLALDWEGIGSSKFVPPGGPRNAQYVARMVPGMALQTNRRNDRGCGSEAKGQRFTGGST
jgi:hypothetical protein